MFAFDTLSGHDFCSNVLIINRFYGWHYIYGDYIKY